jgi:hypothetical protein
MRLSEVAALEPGSNSSPRSGLSPWLPNEFVIRPEPVTVGVTVLRMTWYVCVAEYGSGRCPA